MHWNTALEVHLKVLINTKLPKSCWKSCEKWYVKGHVCGFTFLLDAISRKNRNSTVPSVIHKWSSRVPFVALLRSPCSFFILYYKNLWFPLPLNANIIKVCPEWNMKLKSYPRALQIIETDNEMVTHPLTSICFNRNFSILAKLSTPR